MSEQTGGAQKAPRAVIEQAAAPTQEQAGASDAGAASAAAGAAPGGFQDTTIGFVRGVGRKAWAYADAHPHATLYGLIGFIVAVLILSIGLWATIVIAVFVTVGVIIGQMVDGDSAAVHFFTRLFGGRR